MARNVSMRDALRAALHEEMLHDDRVFIMGEEVGKWQGTHRVTRGLYDEFGPRRVRDTPISEMAIAGAAVGAAMAGLRPVAEMMTINFAFLALDAIINHAAKIHYMFNGQFTVPLVIRAASGWATRRRQPIRTRRSRSLRTSPDCTSPARPTPMTPKACSRRRSATKIRCFSPRVSRSTRKHLPCRKKNISSRSARAMSSVRARM
ncbi:hypothetical protein QPK87_20475 [Kamptonema cortianum]|nr:hypothetical protein [Kamptonema cortianum]